MPIFDLFSKRMKRERGEVPDIYKYNELPEPIRIQIIYILRDAFGMPRRGSKLPDPYKRMHDILCREYGLMVLHEQARNFSEAVFGFFMTCDVEKAFDVIELAFQRIYSDNFLLIRDREISPEEAIEELNYRFLEHGVGYQFEEGKLIRLDSTFLHSKAVKPALLMLSEEKYGGANSEFLSAHEHYRNHRYKECLVDCLKSLESTLKVICDSHSWEYDGRDTANRLLSVCFDNGLIPPYLQAHFSSLRSSLESGVPTIRNKLAGHGQGVDEIKVPPYMAAYQLHLTASAILLLTEADKAFE